MRGLIEIAKAMARAAEAGASITSVRHGEESGPARIVIRANPRCPGHGGANINVDG
jgi:hypothetical protein